MRATSQSEKKSASALLTCEACGSRVESLRRGRCSFCYLRWTDSRPVGMGAACVVCGDRRHDNLRSVEFQRKWVSMCHNCATKTFRLQPIPRTVEAIRQRLNRDRRWQERRFGKNDQRIFKSDRRVSERRSEEMSVEEFFDASDLVVEIIEKDDCDSAIDQTRIALDDDRPMRNDNTGPHLQTELPF